MSEIPVKEQQIAEVQQYVFEAVKLAKDGNYSQVIERLKPSSNEAKKKAAVIGVHLVAGRGRLVADADDEPVSLANEVAMSSSYAVDEKRIQLGFAPQNGPDISHDVALVHLEEWLHAIQHIKGRPFDRQYQDHEIDVAAYLLKQNVPLTPAFLARYDRGEILNIVTAQSVEDDSLNSLPAIRRGVFAKFGEVDDGYRWQVAGFDPNKGDIIFRDLRMQAEYRLPQAQLQPEMFANNNQFENAWTWNDIEVQVRRAGGVIKSDGGVCTPDEVHVLIDQIRGGDKNKIFALPRSGGLRAKVAQMMEQATGKAVVTAGKINNLRTRRGM